MIIYFKKKLDSSEYLDFKYNPVYKDYLTDFIGYDYKLHYKENVIEIWIKDNFDKNFILNESLDSTVNRVIKNFLTNKKKIIRTLKLKKLKNI